MKIDAVKNLASIMSENSLTRLEYSEGDMKLVMERGTQIVQTEILKTESSPLKVSTPAQPNDDDKNTVKVKSPIVGVFYAAFSPEAAPIVSVGTKVKKGDVLCIVEAMKLMNEITSEVDGEISEICVNNADVVEFGQVLFKVTV